ncbi:MAG: DNA translocase FtsK 4TM domain-containing protein, partial [Chloroflexi bacterium]|nr:DNA translocase FtsK 4TM domain-containing protein [Chloroflexota bacterium]
MARTKKIAKTKKQKKAGIQPDYSRILRPQVLGALLLALAGITALAVVFPAGLLGSQWNNLMRLLFGWGAYIMPLVFLSFGLGLLWQHFDEHYRFRWQEAGGWLALFIGCLAMLQLIATNPRALESSDSGGGRLGYIVYQSLFDAIGSVGAIVALFALIIVGVFLAFNISVGQAMGALATGARAALGWYRDTLFPPAKPEQPRTPTGKAAEPRAVALPQTPPQATPERALPAVKIAARAKEGSPVVDAPPVVRGEWQLPSITLLESAAKGEMSATDIRQKIKVVEDTLADFNVQARVIEVNQGPAVTQLGVEPGFHETRGKTGAVIRREKVKVSEITSLTNDLALALAAPTIRIEAPVPGRNVVGIEIPNSSTSMVSLRGSIETERFQKIKAKSKLAIALGEDVSGHAVIGDLAKMPHLLIAGATGSG